MGDVTRAILVTGATGFLGQRIVAAARAAGHPVRAVVRGVSKVPRDWQDDAGITCHSLDLAAGGAVDALVPMLQGAVAVIHAAGALGGDDAAHALGTLAPGETVIGALEAVQADGPGTGARLILVSSYSVYGYAALPDWATLDETTPVEPDPERRDAYARAKLAQETRAIRAAQFGGIEVRILRPGAIYGPGRVATARLGFGIGGRTLCPGGNVPVPAIYVDHAATALVRAATAPMDWRDDLPIIAGGGRFDIVNLVDPDSPTQAQWLVTAGRGKVRLPLRPLMKLARLLDIAGALAPWFGRRLPGALREAALSARFKPLRYSAARAEDRLGHRPERSFTEAMQAAILAGKGPR